MTKFEDLPLLPWVIAEAVCNRPYEGQELSFAARSYADVQKTEELRKTMSPEQIEEFCRLAEAWCKRAHDSGYEWFEKCLSGNRGRDQLYVYVGHWLNAYLNNPERFKKRAMIWEEP